MPRGDGGPSLDKTLRKDAAGGSSDSPARAPVPWWLCWWVVRMAILVVAIAYVVGIAFEASDWAFNAGRDLFQAIF